MTEVYQYQTSIVAECINPDVSLVAVGITFFRKHSQLEEEGASHAIENAREKLAKCPASCIHPCVLKNLANETPEMVLQMLSTNELQLEPGE